MKTKNSLFKKWLQKTRQNKLVAFSTIFLISTLIIAGSLGGYFATRSDSKSSNNLQTIAPDDFITKKHLDDELAKKLSLTDLNSQIKTAHSTLKTDTQFQQHLADSLTNTLATYLKKLDFGAELKTSVQNLKTDNVFQTNLAEALSGEFAKYYSKTTANSTFYSRVALNTLLATYLKKADLTAETKTAITQLKTDTQFQADIAEALTSTFNDYYKKSETDTKLGLKADKTDTYTKTESDTKLGLKADKTDTYTKTESDTKLGLKADKTDTYTKTESDTKLGLKADKADTYTKTESDTKLGLKADKADTYTKTEIDTNLGLKADKADTYTKTEIDTNLGLKADKTDTYTKTESDTKLGLKADKTYTDTELGKKADKTDTYTKTESDTKLGLKADKVDTYTKTESDTKLGLKADKTYTDTELAKKVEYIEVNLDTVSANGKLFTAWGQTELTNLDNLFQTGQVYKIIYNSKTYFVRAANETKTATEIENTFYGIQINESTNKYGLITILISLKGSTTTVTVKAINYEKLKILLDRAEFLHDTANNKYLENQLIFKPFKTSQTMPFVNNERLFTTHASLMAASKGITYRLLDTAIPADGNAKMQITGAHSAWFQSTNPTKWYKDKLQLNAYYGWDKNAETTYGESSTLPNAGSKKFYKGDILYFTFHAHANKLSSTHFAGLKFVLKDKNAAELKTTDAIYFNDWGISHQILKISGQSSTNKAHLMVNLYANKYFEFTGIIRFEETGIYITSNGWINQKADLNTISLDVALAYPTGFADDGITLDEIIFDEVDQATFELQGTSYFEWKNGSVISLRDDIDNKQLAVSQKIVINS